MVMNHSVQAAETIHFIINATHKIGQNLTMSMMPDPIFPAPGDEVRVGERIRGMPVLGFFCSEENIQKL